jgi:hypothetical protein
VGMRLLRLPKDRENTIAKNVKRRNARAKETMLRAAAEGNVCSTDIVDVDNCCCVEE